MSLEIPILVEALVLKSDGSVLLTKRTTRPRIGVWSMPSQFQETQKPSQIVLNVLKEAIGFCPQKVRFLSSHYILMRSEQRRVMSKVMLCSDLKDETIPDALQKDWGWFDWDRLPEKLFDSINALRQDNITFNDIDEIPSWLVHPSRDNWEIAGQRIRFQEKQKG